MESALGTVKSTTDQLALVEIQTKADAEAFRISELQYREGTIDILSLLNNQQNLFSAQQALVQTKLSRLEASLSLYNALGGGWDQKARTKPTRTSWTGGRCKPAVTGIKKGARVAPFLFLAQDLPADSGLALIAARPDSATSSSVSLISPPRWRLPDGSSWRRRRSAR